MRKKLSKNIEWSILICAVLLVVIGLFAIYSATLSSGQEEFRKQIIWLIVSIPLTIAVFFVDYAFMSKMSPILYGISIVLLIAVLFTTPIGGASSWFSIKGVSLQPSEFAKIFLILFLAWLMSIMKKRGVKELNKFTRILLLVVVFAVPVGLIIMQPDYGTAMAFVMAFIFMLFNSGIYKRYIIISLIIVCVAAPFVYIYVLPDHAKTRIQVYLNPDLDPRGAGYNINQSELAIGAGELTGMGYLQGNQTQLGYLYPKSTDFIFAVIGEEMGFIIAALVVVLYCLLISRAIYVAKTAKDDLGSIIAAGIAGIFFFHMVENIGMTMGLLPITGVPLPFVSYGGSSLLSNLIMIGLLLNISGRRQKTIFA